MATAFIMPRLPDHQQAFGHFHAQSQLSSQMQGQTQAPIYTQPQISPLSTGSNSTSPTSPKSYHGRQKRPLYMPAVLRPSQPPARAAAAKKQEDDSDSLKAAAANNGLIGAFGRLSRRSTNDSSKSSDSDWNLFPKPTAQPTRRHWKPDTDSPICDEPSCMRHFNYWTRRHHCRRCGHIFCDSHSAFEIPLDQDANFNPKGAPSRACFRCFNEVRSWRSRANSSSSSDTSSIGSNDYETSGSSPITATPVPGMATPLAPHRAEIAASVPRDWNWSTF